MHGNDVKNLVSIVQIILFSHKLCGEMTSTKLTLKNHSKTMFSHDILPTVLYENKMALSVGSLRRWTSHCQFNYVDKMSKRRFNSVD